MFKVGQKVVCINDEAGWLDEVKLLVKGEIYTVLEVTEKDLVVLPNDGGWDKSRFRPVEVTWVDAILCKITTEDEACSAVLIAP